MKVVILAGGLGTRISEESYLRPKPMIEIGGKPILWHIMKLYSAHGADDFVICCGYKGYVIKEYFANYFLHMSDVTFDMADNSVVVHQRNAEPWRVTLIDTGENTQTGGRLKRVAAHIRDEEAFCFTYGDGVSDVNIRSCIDFHRGHGRLATVTAVRPPGRYGALERAGDAVTRFVEKPPGDGGMINGGFFVLSPRCLDFIEGDDSRWEGSPIIRLAAMGQMMAFEHRGFWQAMDTLRDKAMLEELLGIRQGAMEDMALTRAPAASFWHGKRVLLTGHTGFKGSWLLLWLHRLGARVTGISLPPATAPNLYGEIDGAGLCDSEFCDIREASGLAALVKAARPQLVFHLAAQPLVRAGYGEPRATFETNVMGTVNVLEALRGLDGVRAAVMVTTDKVYRDRNGIRPYAEDDPLGGHDPYSASKAASEMVIASYRDAFLSAQGVAVASARAGNVIGGGDWSDDRLIPDAVRAWQAGNTLQVRRPQAVRPWQHVLEPLAGYLVLAQELWERPARAGAYNFGPRSNATASVRNVVELARGTYGKGDVTYGDGSEGPHESEWLALDASLAKAALGVTPVFTLAEAVRRTMTWYRSHRDGANAYELCRADISAFEVRAQQEAAGDTPSAPANPMRKTQTAS